MSVVYIKVRFSMLAYETIIQINFFITKIRSENVNPIEVAINTRMCSIKSLICLLTYKPNCIRFCYMILQ